MIAASLVLVLSEEIEEYDYEDDGGAAPPPPPPPQHVGRGRIPLPSSRQNKGPALIGNANKINGKPGVRFPPSLPLSPLLPFHRF